MKPHDIGALFVNLTVPMGLLVFLDIDGVLRRESSPKYKLQADLVERFELWAREQEDRHGSIEILISSSWREAFSLEELRQKFNSAYLWLRITAVTPTLVGDRAFPRYDEIIEYLKSVDRLDEDWVATDDTADLYPPRLENLIICDPEEGFRPS